MRYSFFIVLLAALALVSCVETPNFDNTPSIQFNSIDKYTVKPDPFYGPNARADSVVITIDFEDGDGDLGITQEERSDTAVLNSKYRDWGNYELKVLRLENNRFVQLPFLATQKLFFPVLKRDGKPGPIKGKLDFSQTFFYSRTARPSVLKFQVRIRDRALRASNVIETDTISVPLD
jgi:hypothetical protein